jgi:hypothetical protein
MLDTINIRLETARLIPRPMLPYPLDQDKTPPAMGEPCASYDYYQDKYGLQRTHR